MTTHLTGTIWFVLFGAGILTLFFSILLLWMYRRATLAGMSRAANMGTGRESPLFVPQQEDPVVVPNNVPLQVLDISNTLAASAESTLPRSIDDKPGVALDHIRSSQRRTAAVYFAGGLTYALVMTVAWTLSSGAGFSIARSLIFFSIYLWPVVITLCMLTALSSREYFNILASYALLVAVALLVALLRNPDLSMVSLLVLWFISNLPASIFSLFFLQERLRSVGPIIFTFMLCGVTGAFLLLIFAGQSDVTLGALASVGQLVGLGAGTLLFLVFATGFSIAALLIGRPVLRKLGDAYNRKQFSDRSIIIDSLWVMFAFIQSISLLFEGAIFMLTAPIAFIAYRTVVGIGFHVIHADASKPEKQLDLLLLRVFSLGRRSNRFYDKFSKLWRQVGVINMIAGPDLVTAAIEPHEFLEFAGGKLSRRFVVSEEDLDTRIRDRDLLPDPDGRYRVHEFFCHDDTWRTTMQKLAIKSDAILMDLRSFSSSNQGCLFELKVLLDNVDMRRVVFVIDKSTDRAFLETSYRDLWSAVDSYSPNRDQSVVTISLFPAEAFDRKTVRVLTRHLLGHLELA